MKDDRLYLIHILECVQKIQDYTTAGEAFFKADSKTQDAVIRNFEIIGEAAKRVSPEGRDRSPDIPWQHIAGFRDVLIHQYEGVDIDQVWRVVEQELATLRGAIERLLNELNESAERNTKAAEQESDSA